MDIRYSTLLSTAALLLANACSTTRPAELSIAEQDLTRARSQVASSPAALRTLDEAEEDLLKAQEVWEMEGDQEQATHLAYLAERKIDIARLNAEEQHAIESLATAQLERDRYKRASRYERARARLLESEVDELEAKLENVETEVTGRGFEIGLEQVHFNHDQAELSSGARQVLRPIADYLRRNPEREVRIEGYADRTGTHDYNLRLSRERAQAVQGFLEENGIASERIEIVAKGDTMPMVTDEGRAERLQNRRALLIIR